MRYEGEPHEKTLILTLSSVARGIGPEASAALPSSNKRRQAIAVVSGDGEGTHDLVGPERCDKTF
jgi:hypothetical protein